MADAGSQPQRVTRVTVAGSRTIAAATFFVRDYTVFTLQGEVEGIGGVRPEPVVSERRFAEIADFHAVWCEPIMSPDRPVFLPPKEPVSFVMKNDAELVAARVVAIRAPSSRLCLSLLGVSLRSPTARDCFLSQRNGPTQRLRCPSASATHRSTPLCNCFCVVLMNLRGSRGEEVPGPRAR